MNKLVAVLALAAVLNAGQASAGSVDKLFERFGLGNTRQAVTQLIAVFSANKEAKKDRRDIRAALKESNDGQPGFIFRGATIEVQFAGKTDWWQLDEKNEVISSISGLLTGLGARPTFDRASVERETADRQYYRRNPDVNQYSLPAPGTILIARTILELSFIQLKDTESYAKFFPGFNGYCPQGSRTTAYCGITATLRNRDTGEAFAVYRVLEQARDTSNGYFGNSYGYNSQDDLRFRAQEYAIRSLGQLLQSKSPVYGRGR